MTQVTRGVGRFEMSVTGGSVTLSYPSPMDQSDVDDLRFMLAEWLKRIDRHAIKQPPKAPPDEFAYTFNVQNANAQPLAEPHGFQPSPFEITRGHLPNPNA